MDKDVIIACDFPNMKTTMDFLDKFEDTKPFLKIGMELYYSEGPRIVEKIKSRGHKIFLDLKLHDIPNTVRRAMRVLAGFDVDMCTLHASGSSAMMQAAKEGLEINGRKNTILIAVTQLTSISQEIMNKELLISVNIEDVVVKYAQNAKKSGLDGVVCSPHESMIIHDICGNNFLTVTPGIRFEKNIKDDQSRIMTPKEAKEAGSDYIVIGRPITTADDPVLRYKKSLLDFLGKGA